MDLAEDFPWGTSVADEMLRIHRSYAKSVLNLTQRGYVGSLIRGSAHITGGGITGNLVRILPEGRKAIIHRGTWERPPIFPFLQKAGSVPQSEMDRTFNNGIGFVLVAKKEKVEEVIWNLNEFNEQHWIIGEIVEGEREVVLV
jgi:phosphoribosylformylglycinamidine cyclo-ligase